MKKSKPKKRIKRTKKVKSKKVIKREKNQQALEQVKEERKTGQRTDFTKLKAGDTSPRGKLIMLCTCGRTGEKQNVLLPSIGIIHRERIKDGRRVITNYCVI